MGSEGKSKQTEKLIAKHLNFHVNLQASKQATCGISTTHREYFIVATVDGFLQFLELLHQPFGSDCGVHFGDHRKLLLLAAWRNCAAANGNHEIEF